MKRFFSAILLTLAFIICFSVVSYAATSSWYCIRVKDNKRPPLPSEFSYIENYNGYYIGKDPEDKVIYITFDAGYENGNISKILDVLKEEQVCSAFFILSNLAAKNPELIKRMSDEGHLICNHTSTHKDMTKINNIQDFEDELLRLENFCAENNGVSVAKYFRPPEGKFNENTLKFANELGYKTIFWSFAYADWDNNKQMSKEAATKKILDNVHPGAVVLLHPTSETNALILSDVIKDLKAQGYRFGTLDELTQQKAC